MIQIHNQSNSPTTGWFHTTVDTEPPHAAGQWDGPFRYVKGARLGAAGWHIDVYYSLNAHQRITLDLSRAVASTPFKLELPPEAMADPIGYFGVPELFGIPFSFVGLRENGAHYDAHLRLRPVNSLVCFDLYLEVYPGASEYHGELVMTCSNVSIPDLHFTFTVPLEIGGVALLPAGTVVADGQQRKWPVIYTRAGGSLRSYADQVYGKGMERIGPLGVIADRGQLNVRRWLEQNHPDAWTALFRWQPPWQVGCAANSTVTGDQEDQGFSQGFESFYGVDLKTVVTRYLTALGQAKRPCHHLDAAGNPVDPEAQNIRVVYWNGRPHYNRLVSPNQFNKPRGLAEWDCNGWYGPDREHFLINTVAAAYELTGSRALQDEMVHHAYLILGSETLDPALATTGTDAARSLGWLGLAASHLWCLLDDRTLADRVRSRWLARYAMHRNKWGLDLWDVRWTDQQTPQFGLATSKFWMGYQQAVGAYGAYVASVTFGDETGRLFAVRGAQQVVDHCYVLRQDSRYEEWEIMGCDASGALVHPSIPVDGVNAHRTGFYRRAWMPLALWTVLDAAPNSRTLDIWRQIKGEPIPDIEWYRTDDWMPPLRNEALR